MANRRTELCLFQKEYDAGIKCRKSCKYYTTCTRKHSEAWRRFCEIQKQEREG